MASPTSDVFLNFIPEEEAQAYIRAVINIISTIVEGDSFLVNTTLPIGGTINVTAKEARPFSLIMGKIADEGFPEADELAQIETFFHTRPVYSLLLLAGSKREVDHRILGEMTMYLAEKLNGLICLDMSTEAADTAIIGGKFHNIICDCDDGTKEALYSICDTEFMKNWLNSPRFNMGW